jgi:hypothetical protein
VRCTLLFHTYASKHLLYIFIRFLNKRTIVRYIHTYHSFNHSLFFHSYCIVYGDIIYNYRTSNGNRVYRGNASDISGKGSIQLDEALSAVEKVEMVQMVQAEKAEMVQAKMVEVVQ